MKILDKDQSDPGNIDWSVHMQRALALAGQVLTTTPNPRVGCVLINQGRVVGEGWHAAAGTAHAEINALQAAGASAKGATVVVTLEPCAHQGRTGPCCDALIRAGVSKVIIAAQDPNPKVAGKGIRALEAAGVEVWHLQAFENQTRALNRGYFRRRESGLPFVTLKLAMSLDGRTALANGKSKWITGGPARSDVQKLRASSSAVLTGINTVLADDPALTVRRDELRLTEAELAANATALETPPLRVIVDSQLRTPGAARIFSSPGPIAIFHAAGVSPASSYREGVQLVPVSTEGERVSLRSVLELLASKFQCNEVLVESGAELGAGFLNAGLVDELVVYMAPRLLGKDGRALLNIDGPGDLSEGFKFRIKEHEQFGEDLKLVLGPG